MSNTKEEKKRCKKCGKFHKEKLKSPRGFFNDALKSKLMQISKLKNGVYRED